MVTLSATLMKNKYTDMLNFAQLFIMKNGRQVLGYLLVEPGKLSNLNTKFLFQQGDTLSVYVGYHESAKNTFGGGSKIDGLNLEKVRLCLFPSY